MKGLSPKLQAKLLKATTAGKSAAKRVKESGITSKLASVGVTTAGGVVGGALDGVFAGKRMLGANPSTVAGVGTTFVSLFLKGESGQRTAEIAGGMLALSAGKATTAAVKKAKVNEFLDGLTTPQRGAIDERRRSHQNLSPEEKAAIEAKGSRLPPGVVKTAGDASGTVLTASELRSFADGSA